SPRGFPGGVYWKRQLLSANDLMLRGNTALSMIFPGYTNPLCDRKLLYSLPRPDGALPRLEALSKIAKGTSTSNNKNLRLLALVVLLLLIVVPATSYIFSIFGNHSFPSVHPVFAANGNFLGVNCAYGASTPGVAFPSPIQTKDGSG